MSTKRNLVIDNQLLEIAMLLGGEKTPKETGYMALEEFLKQRKTKDIAPVYRFLDKLSDSLKLSVEKILPLNTQKSVLAALLALSSIYCTLF